MEILYPLVAVTHYCFNTLPPPGSTCNCSTPPPAFNVKFPLDFTTTEEATTSWTTEQETTSSHNTIITGDGTSIPTTLTVRRQPSGTASTPGGSNHPTYKTDDTGTKPDAGTQTGTSTQSTDPVSLTSMELGSSSSSDPVTSPTTPPDVNSTASNATVTNNLQTTSLSTKTTHDDPDSTASNENLMNNSKTGTISTKGDTTRDVNGNTAHETTSMTDTFHDKDGQNGTEPWVIILIICFILIACIVIAIIVFCYLKKHGYLVKCKVHPDGKCSDEEKMTDLGPDVAAGSDASSRTPLNGSPPEAVAAAAATETGANPSDQNGVRKVYKKGSVELKPLTHPSAPRPISSASPLRRPSEGNLTEPETDHPEFLGNQDVAAGAAAGVATGKPKKKKKKKKKKPAGNNPDAVQDGNNTEDPPNG